LSRRTARLALRCTRVAGPVGPVGIDVERPRGTLDLVINLATAKALSVEIPPKLLALADEVIE